MSVIARVTGSFGGKMGRGGAADDCCDVASRPPADTTISSTRSDSVRTLMAEQSSSPWRELHTAREGQAGRGIGPRAALRQYHRCDRSELRPFRGVTAPKEDPRVSQQSDASHLNRRDFLKAAER